MDSKLRYSRWKIGFFLFILLFFFFLCSFSACLVLMPSQKFPLDSSQFWSSPFLFPFTTALCWKPSKSYSYAPLGLTGPKGKTEQIREARSCRPGHWDARHDMFSSFVPNILHSLFPFPVSCACTIFSARCLALAGESSKVYCPVDLPGYFV